jgi:hypothetical protein
VQTYFPRNDYTMQHIAGKAKGVSGCWFVCLLVLSTPLAAKDRTPLLLARGARLGVIDLLEPEVTHFHYDKAVKDTALKTETLDWPVDVMLSDALKDRAAQMGLVLVPLAVTDELDRSRESCFLNGNFAKSLPKECVLPLQHLLSASHVEAVIVLAPGLNNSTHAGSTRRKELPDYVRGWGVVTGESDSPDGKPAVFSMTELLLVGSAAAGPVLRGREWGGSYSLEWTGFTAPPNLKEIPLEAYSQLQPLYADILSRQAARLFDQIEVR